MASNKMRHNILFRKGRYSKSNTACLTLITNSKAGDPAIDCYCKSPPYWKSQDMYCSRLGTKMAEPNAQNDEKQYYMNVNHYERKWRNTKLRGSVGGRCG